MKKCLLITCLLAACAPQRPEFTNAPKNDPAYRVAYDACVRDVDTPTGAEALAGSFGLAGLLVEAAAGDERVTKSRETQIGDCLRAKGYAL
jgi:hypothetical protein